MADLRTTVTELVTGLGTLGHDDVATALAARPAEMVSVSPENWTLLERAFEGGALATEFDQAFANGRALLEATDGLRGRRPRIVEWKGAQSNPGDEVLPVDLRIDHVYLVSCKYLSKIVHNAAPTRVFDHSLRAAATTRALDWYAETAPTEYQSLYEATVDHIGVEDLPAKVTELTKAERTRMKDAYPSKWPVEVESAYAALCTAVSTASAERWASHLATRSEQEATLWRLLRFGPAPYFVIGTAKTDSLRLRIATPWDWRQGYELRRLTVSPKAGGQPMVTWRAAIRDRHTAASLEVEGHVEIRWSHGRFGGPPEAKVYLDTPHGDIPGYFPLSTVSEADTAGVVDQERLGQSGGVDGRTLQSSETPATDQLQLEPAVGGSEGDSTT